MKFKGTVISDTKCSWSEILFKNTFDFLKIYTWISWVFYYYVGYQIA